MIIFGIAGLLVGLGSAWLGLAWSRQREIRWAENEANEWLDGAKKDADASMEELKLAMEEMKEEAEIKFERDTKGQVKKNEEREELLLEMELQAKQAASTKEAQLNRKYSEIQNRERKVQQIETRVQSLRQKVQQQLQNLKVEAEKRSPVPATDIKAQLARTIEHDAFQRATQLALEFEQESQLNTERDAKKTLNLALNRFARPYCSERGIGNIAFESGDHKVRTFGANGELAKKIEQICGVDIVFNETYMSATVMGFDPVRRELGRLVLEATAKERNPTASSIETTFERCKKDLFKRILNDGNRVAQELGLRELHENVRSMLGALRYRYSFSQNQFFHVAEVGWLGGLLSAELGVPVEDGRRAGVLHDIGKAMDHSKEGGHAVIGAEFIETNGEKSQIVHAVRAHHYDEQPSTDLAFLTIAADAISGARPGARRSTVDSYTQKMADLEKIGFSFEGVTATYVLSAGRELRVIVDGQRVDDHRALDLSKSMAKKIEDELNYPGQIKVTVVRETQAIEFAR